ncbi:MAG: RloB family protein [Muribaculaceae bacterium]|nr:RloB family protein [Muribaculaceae bacterium]
MITRRKDYAKRAPSKDASKIYIISEGTVSEIRYLNFFTGLSSNLELIVIPSENGTDPLKLKELAKEKFFGTNRSHTLDYAQKDQIWFVIDTDTWEREGKIAPLREFCHDNNSNISKMYDEVKPYGAWNVVQSNPCFEVWLYYHLYDSAPDPASVPNEANIKRYVDILIGGGFDYECDPARIQSAIQRARRAFHTDEKGKLGWFATEFFKLGEEIEKFTSSETRKLLGKLTSGHLPQK